MLTKADYYKLEPARLKQMESMIMPIEFLLAPNLGSQIDILYDLVDAPGIQEQYAKEYLLLAATLIRLPFLIEEAENMMDRAMEAHEAEMEADEDDRVFDLLKIEATEFVQDANFLSWMDKQYEG